MHVLACKSAPVCQVFVLHEEISESARGMYRNGVVQEQRAALLRLVAIEHCGTNVVRDAVVLVKCASLPAAATHWQQIQTQHAAAAHEGHYSEEDS